jgi:hypothetical protein
MPKKGEYKKGAKADSVRQRAYNSSPTQKNGKDVDHKNMNPKDNRKGNLQVISKSKNRAKNQWAKAKR